MTENHDGHPTGIDPEDTTRWLQQLRADMAASVNGSLLRGARPVQVGNIAPSGATTMRPTMSAGALLGYTIAGNVGSPPDVVRISDREGNLIALVPFGGAGGDHIPAVGWFGPGGINIPDGGIFLTAVEDFEGVVYLRGSD